MTAPRPITPDNPRTEPWNAEELALIERERQKWLAVGMDTSPVKPAAIRKAVTALCKRAGREPGHIHIAPGPRAAHIAIAVWRKFGLKKMQELCEGPKADYTAARALLKDGDLKYEWTWFWGQHEAYWVGWYRTAQMLGVQFTSEQEEQLAEFEALCLNAGWWWPFENGQVVMGRQSVIRMEPWGTEGRMRLHCEDGPALAYPDGWEVYAWHGVRVPRAVIMEPITLQQIEKEENAEIRRVLLARYGYDKWVQDVGAKAIQQDDFGALYDIPLGDGRTIRMIRVVNGTPEPDGEGRADCERGGDGNWYKVYWLRTLSDVETAHEAVAKSYGLTVEEYDPLART